MLSQSLTRMNRRQLIRSRRLLTLKSESEVKHDANNERPEFPGSRSQFTTELKFVDPSSYDTLPIFRILNQKGQFISKNYSDQLDLKLAKRFFQGLNFMISNFI